MGHFAEPASSRAGASQPGSAPPAAFSGGGKVLQGPKSYGPPVKELTRRLRRAGFEAVELGPNYTPNVVKAVKALQVQAGLLPAHGKYDEATRSVLDQRAPAVIGPATRKPRDPRIDKLIAGAYAGDGEYKDSGDGFVKEDLQALLEQYGAFWAVDISKPSAASEGEDRPAAPAGGDSAGKGVTIYPPWVNRMQALLIVEDSWSDDHTATQKLLQAFMTADTKARAGKVHSSVDAFFSRVGHSEENRQSTKVFNAPKGTGDWCAQASQYMLAVGLYRKGIRAKTKTHAKEGQVEIVKQTNVLLGLLKKSKEGIVRGTAAWTAALEPGDIISIVNGGPGGPLSGHVATVIEEVGSKIRIVSGNAGGGGIRGNGSVRAEEVLREEPPQDYNWETVSAVSNAAHNAEGAREKAESSRKAAEAASEDKKDAAEAKAAAASAQKEEAEAKAASEAEKHPDLPTSRTDKKFVPGKHAPAKPGASWVVSIIRASQLDANVLGELSDAELEKQGLERCEPLDKLYPELSKWV